jgi:hypothetical protein
MAARPSHRTGRTAVITVAAGVLMAGAVSGVAAADPPALDRDPCSVAIAAAGVWPGTYDTAHHQYRLVSDAYDSYLSSQPECSTDLATR